MQRISHLQRARLRNLHFEVVVLLIDEKSMVSNVCLLQIHKRLRQIFCCLEKYPFGCLSILAVFYLLQLPPVKSSQIFEAYNNAIGAIFNLWSLLLMAELTEVMRQRGDQTFTYVL